MNRNFVTGLRNLAGEVERLEKMNNRAREIFRDPGAPGPPPPWTGSAVTSGRALPFEFLQGLLQMCYLPEIEPSRKVCF